MYIDTHAHLYLSHFKDDIVKVMDDALAKGVEHIYLPNIDRHSTPFMKALRAKFPDMCSCMMGVHPGSVREDFEEELKHVEHELRTGDYVAVGEIGTDLYWDQSYRDQQEIAFEQQIQWALQYDLPIVIHARESLDWTIELVEKNQNGKLKGIFHCFTGHAGQAERIMELGFLMGIGGVLTYKNSVLAKILGEIPLDYLVLETDAPFLPPVPHRGRRNESAFIPIIAQHLALAKRCGIQEVAEVTTENAKRLFGPG